MSQSDQKPVVTPAEQIETYRHLIAGVIFNYFPKLLVLVIFMAIFLCVIIGTKWITTDTTEKMALAASIQVAFGMVVGFVCVFIGLMMTWFGLNASFEVSGKGGGGEVNLKSASPGLLFALGGMILLAVSLYKPIVYQDTSSIIRRDINPPPPFEDKK